MNFTKRASTACKINVNNQQTQGNKCTHKLIVFCGSRYN